MKRKITTTILWMMIFTAGTFCLIPLTFAVLVFSRIVSDTSLVPVLWALRLIFVASPWVALWLGLRGALPGTNPLPVTQPGTNTITRTLTLIVIVIVGCFALGAWVAFQPLPGRPRVAIGFLGYTHDATGTCLAKIAVTNLNASRIFVYAPRIETQAPANPGGYENYFSGVNCSWQAKLASGAAGTFTIPPPTNPSMWRLSFYVDPGHGGSARQTLTRMVSISCLSAGLWPRFANYLPLDGAFRMPFKIDGDWIKNDP